MIRRWIYLSLWAALSCFAQFALAYVEQPIIFPSHPAAGELVSIKIVAGICDGFLGGSDDALVSQSGSNIEVLVDSNHFPKELCLLQPGREYTFNVGAFPAGAYTLSVRRRYPVLSEEEIVETLGEFSMVISGSTVNSSAVPVDTIILKGSLAALLLGVGIFAIWRRQYLLITPSISRGGISGPRSLSS